MSPHSELDTLRIRLADPALAALGLGARVQRVLREMVLDGLLLPGSRLPPTRSLAKSLGLSRDTVEIAYAQLQAEGYVVRRIGSGSYVAGQVGAELAGLAQAPRRQPASLVAGDPAPAIGRRGAAIAASGGMQDNYTVRAFVAGVPETRNFPLAAWERLQKQVLKDYRATVLQHGDPQGAEPLRRAIAEYVNLERGARASADQVLILSCSQQALALCALMLADAGAPIFIEEPAYNGARKAFEAAQLELVPVPVDEQGVRTDRLETDPSRARAIYVTPSHQYPTGATLSLSRRLELVNWAARNEAWIIEDDYDSEFHYDGQPTACVQGLDRNLRTLYIGTFSKSLFPGLRLGYMVLPPALVRPMTVARTLLDGHSPMLPQLTLARFIDSGQFGAYVRMMRKVYAARRQAMAEAVAGHLDGIVTARVPPGGLQMACLLAPGRSEKSTIEAAARIGLRLPSLGALYRAKPAPEGWLLGFAALTPGEIDASVRLLAETLRAR